MNAMNDDAITVLIRRRRTIKPAAMSCREVDDRLVARLLENANWAPTHGMTEPWRFSVFTGDARVRLAQFLAETYRQVTPTAKFREQKLNNLLTNPPRAPAVIAIGMQRQQSEKIPEIEEIAAVACAVQNMHLTATALGLGGFWSSNAAVCSDRMREFLGLGMRDRVLGLFYLGYPAGRWPDGERGPISEKVEWIRE